MTADVMIEMMTGDFILWRCLHDGPLSNETMDRWKTDTKMPWERYRIRNRTLIEKLTAIYGSCAVLARHGNEIVGQLRFYPKAVWETAGAGLLCLQQDSPAGPDDNFASTDFPPFEKLTDRTLKVHCLMTAPLRGQDYSFQRKGIGTGMARKLINWAAENGWQCIEAEAFEDLPFFYQVTGSAGRTFWEKLGFHIADRFPHPHLREYPEFVNVIEEQALAAGIDRERAKDSIIMRLDLA